MMVALIKQSPDLNSLIIENLLSYFFKNICGEDFKSYFCNPNRDVA
jgi:hypothetical protein